MSLQMHVQSSHLSCPLVMKKAKKGGLPIRSCPYQDKLDCHYQSADLSLSPIAFGDDAVSSTVTNSHN